MRVLSKTRYCVIFCIHIQYGEGNGVLVRSHNPSKRPSLDSFFSNGNGFIEIVKCALFGTNCPISCDTRSLFLQVTPRKEYTNKMASEITFAGHVIPS